MRGTVNVSLDIQAEECIRALTWLQKEQLPFAYAKTLTRIAQESAEKVRARTIQEFDLHTDFIPKGVGVGMARKAEILTKGRTQSTVFTKERISTFMPKQEYGTERVPSSASMGGGSDRGKSLAMPGKGTKGAEYADSKAARARLITGSGKVKSSKTPRSFIKAGKSGKGVFIVKMKNSGLPAIVRRKGKKGKRARTLEVLYIFRDKADYDKRWQFVETVADYANKNFNRIFTEEIGKAVRDARL